MSSRDTIYKGTSEQPVWFRHCGVRRAPALNTQHDSADEHQLNRSLPTAQVVSRTKDSEKAPSVSPKRQSCTLGPQKTLLPAKTLHWWSRPGSVSSISCRTRDSHLHYLPRSRPELPLGSCWSGHLSPGNPGSSRGLFQMVLPTKLIASLGGKTAGISHCWPHTVNLLVERWPTWWGGVGGAGA